MLSISHDSAVVSTHLIDEPAIRERGENSPQQRARRLNHRGNEWEVEEAVVIEGHFINDFRDLQR